jgi:hypothetical protein
MDTIPHDFSCFCSTCHLLQEESYGRGIVGGRDGEWGIEGMADRVVRNARTV